jgi:hypothetical protein
VIFAIDRISRDDSLERKSDGMSGGRKLEALSAVSGKLHGTEGVGKSRNRGQEKLHGSFKEQQHGRRKCRRRRRRSVVKRAVRNRSTHQMRRNPRDTRTHG